MNFKCNRTQARDTGMAATLIILLIVFFTKQITLVIPAICLLFLTMAWPNTFKPVAPFWFGLSHLLGSIVSTIFFSLIFILFATPVGLFRRILGYDSMNLKSWKKGPDSVFITRNHIYTSKDLEKPF